jgi:hypothetical protein
MSILDWFRPPVIIEGDQKYWPTPYRSHCPEKDWTSHRWWADTTSPREEHASHYLTVHYRPSGRVDDGAWGRRSTDGGFGSGWGSGLDY